MTTDAGLALHRIMMSRARDLCHVLGGAVDGRRACQDVRGTVQRALARVLKLVMLIDNMYMTCTVSYWGPRPGPGGRRHPGY